MKTSKLQKLAWLFIAIILTTSSMAVLGQNQRNKAAKTTSNMPCIEQITGLSDQQKTEMQAKAEKHQAVMEITKAGELELVELIKETI